MACQSCTSVCNLEAVTASGFLLFPKIKVRVVRARLLNNLYANQ
jgi:hypothetical protein